MGSIEFADLAKIMASLTSASGQFKGDTAKNVNVLGAIMQTAIAGGARDPAEAATAIQQFTADLASRGGASKGIYKKLGIDLFETQMIDGKETRTQLKHPRKCCWTLSESPVATLPP